MKMPDIPELHELRDFTAVLSDGTVVKGEYPDKQFPDVRPQRWRIKIHPRGRGLWPMVEARLEDITSPQDLWNRIVAIRMSMGGGCSVSIVLNEEK